MDNVGTTLKREYGRYTQVIQLGSAAILGKPYYHCDEVRNESITEALEIEAAIRRVWSAHPGYVFVAAQPDLDGKYSHFRQLILRQL
jgi:hypothetical protein